MPIFSLLFDMFQTNPPRAWAITAIEILVLASVLWVSITDIKYKKIAFWKMLVAGAMVVIGPVILSFFYRCEELGTLHKYLIWAVPMWAALLYLNIRFNKDRFMGKADVDLLSAVFSLGVTFSFWHFSIQEDSSIAAINVTTFWYRLLGYMLLGALVYLVVFIIIVVVNISKNGTSFMKTFKGTKISVIPMFLPLCLMAPYLVMIP